MMICSNHDWCVGYYPMPWIFIFLKLDIFSSSYDKVGWGRYRIAVFSGTEKISVFLARSTPEDENITLYWKGYDIGKGQDN
jgi:hypothetical protein